MGRNNRSQQRRRKRKNNNNDWYLIDEELHERSDVKRAREHFDEQDLKKLNKRLNKQVVLAPRGENQKAYVTNLVNPEQYIIVAIGPAGCGKTMLATQAAVKGLIEEKYERIIMTRPNTAVDDKDIGFLPGDIHKKMAPWIAPLVDVLKETYTPNEIKGLFRDEVIEIVPIAYMRGRTFKNAFIIVDEAQNTTPSSLLSILTRIGDNSKLVVTGDLKQTDHRGVNGLEDFIDRFDKSEEAGNTIEGICINEFDNNDIQRHPVISKILDLYDDIELE
jgi:phosphate starvation-inducible PhoH-like protein